MARRGDDQRRGRGSTCANGGRPADAQRKDLITRKSHLPTRCKRLRLRYLLAPSAALLQVYRELRLRGCLLASSTVAAAPWDGYRVRPMKKLPQEKSAIAWIVWKLAELETGGTDAAATRKLLGAWHKTRGTPGEIKAAIEEHIQT